MLYILNKPTQESLRQLAVIGAGDDEKAVLLISDAVFLALPAGLARFAGLEVESFYAAKDAVSARVLEPDDEVELLDYDGMARLLEDYDNIVTL